ncbi:unnamed protein product [Phytophthora lilii]|uniref:Unnamed protein product n=1 Tax=Phytophthora lilii TaxID=2077276 RepID=A0A9W6TUK7_9STRA|nr:unnamed protein product [Phytophthora lilii]
MNVFVLTVAAAVALSVAGAVDQTLVDLGFHEGDPCTITNESQCDGQNWIGSKCCVDPSYECRWADDGDDTKRCQKILHNSDGVYADWGPYDSGSSDYSYDDDFNSDDAAYASYVNDWDDCTNMDVGCLNSTSACIAHSAYYAQCKPETLPSGELCGQDDGTNVWYYDRCPYGELCNSTGSEYRCFKMKSIASTVTRKYD